MEALWHSAGAFLWNEKWWFGENAKWEDLVSTDPEVYYPRVRDMNWSLLVGLGLMVLRNIYEKVLIRPLAASLGVKERKERYLTPNATLEAAFISHSGRVPDSEIQSLRKQTDLTERQIQRWLYTRKLQTVPSALYKFKECSWHFFCYTFLVLFGLRTLWDKPWGFSTVRCWIGWPKQHIDTDVFFLYLIELGFYWSLLFAMLFQKDYHKKDKKEMIVHHCFTIALMYFSWACNFVRGGALIVVLHDFVDPWLAIAKMAQYSKHQRTCEIFFGMFILTWLVSRCVIYPLWILNMAVFEMREYAYLSPAPAYWLFNALLFGLQFLHLFWTYLILRVACQKVLKGSIEKDSRSESESEMDEPSSDEEDETHPSVNHTVANGNVPVVRRSRHADSVKQDT